MIQIITSGDSGMHNMDPSLKKKNYYYKNKSNSNSSPTDSFQNKHDKNYPQVPEVVYTSSLKPSLTPLPKLFQVRKHTKTFQAPWQCCLGTLLTPTKRLWEAQYNDRRFCLLICDENQASADGEGRVKTGLSV